TRLRQGEGRPAPADTAGLGISHDGDHLSGCGRAHAARGPVRELRTERPARPHVQRRGAPRHEFPARDRGYAHEFRRLGRPELSVRVGGTATMTTPLPEGRLTRDHLEQLLGKMADRRVVVVGAALLDIYLSGVADRISPEAPVPVVTFPTRRCALGRAGHVA